MSTEGPWLLATPLVRLAACLSARCSTSSNAEIERSNWSRCAPGEEWEPPPLSSGCNSKHLAHPFHHSFSLHRLFPTHRRVRAVEALVQKMGLRCQRARRHLWPGDRRITGPLWPLLGDQRSRGPKARLPNHPASLAGAPRVFSFTCGWVVTPARNRSSPVGGNHLAESR